jgi:hypothetical protein
VTDSNAIARVEAGLVSNPGTGPAAPLLIKSAGGNSKTTTPKSATTRPNCFLPFLFVFDFCGKRGSPNPQLGREPVTSRRQLRSINFDSLIRFSQDYRGSGPTRSKDQKSSWLKRERSSFLLTDARRKADQPKKIGIRTIVPMKAYLVSPHF